MCSVNKLKRLWYGQSSEAQKTIIAGVLLAIIFFAGGIAIGKNASEQIPSDRVTLTQAEKELAANFQNSIPNKVSSKKQINSKAFWAGKQEGYITSFQNSKDIYVVSYYNEETQDLTNPGIITSQCTTEKKFFDQAKLFADSKRIETSGADEIAFYSETANSIIAFKKGSDCESIVAIQNFDDPKEILAQLEPGVRK